MLIFQLVIWMRKKQLKKSIISKKDLLKICLKKKIDTNIKTDAANVKVISSLRTTNKPVA
jgi:hypothetical protein